MEKLSPKRNRVEKFLSFCFALFAMAIAMAILMSPRAFVTLPVLGVETVVTTLYYALSQNNH